MRVEFSKQFLALSAAAWVVCCLNSYGQNSQPQPAPQSTASSQAPAAQQAHQTSPGGEVGKGAGDVGKGTAKGTGAAAEGVGKGAGDVVTLHPVKGAESIGKGGVVAGKDIGVGAAKGTGKIAKGTGRGIGKLFHHHHEKQDARDSAEPQN